MQLIYIHGLDSGRKSIKGKWLEQYCAEHHPEIIVQRPDLNMPPLEVMEHITQLIKQDSNSMLVGSSLGGFFTTALVAQHNIPAVLINPSIRPFQSLKRYGQDVAEDDLTTVLHSTDGGWNITRQDFIDLQSLYHDTPKNVEKILVLLKTGDEVIDYRIAHTYFSQEDIKSTIIIDEGGDHFMHDLREKIPLIMQFLYTKK